MTQIELRLNAALLKTMVEFLDEQTSNDNHTLPGYINDNTATRMALAAANVIMAEFEAEEFYAAEVCE